MGLFKKDKKVTKENEENEKSSRSLYDKIVWDMRFKYMMDEFKNERHKRDYLHPFTYSATACLVEAYGPDLVIEKIKESDILLNHEIKALTLMVNVSQMEIELINENTNKITNEGSFIDE